jgi:hypothetical protein
VDPVMLAGSSRSKTFSRELTDANADAETFHQAHVAEVLRGNKENAGVKGVDWRSSLVAVAAACPSRRLPRLSNSTFIVKNNTTLYKETTCLC